MNARTTILCGNLLTMNGAERKGPQTVVVEAGKVTEIRAGHDRSAADDVIDLATYTVLPGLIDCHGHLELDILKGDEPGQVAVSDGALALRMAKNAAINLRRGVTTIRLCGTKNLLDFALRAEIQRGGVPGPRLVTAGRGIASSQTQNVNQVTADGISAVVAATRTNISLGADFIKVFATGGSSPSLIHGYAAYLSEAELQAIVMTARQCDLPVAAHAYGGNGVDACLNAGVSHIEHGIFLTPQQFARMAEQGMWLIGTLGVFLTEPGLAELPGRTEAVRNAYYAAREGTWKSIGEAARAGVNYALGTDAIQGEIAGEAILAAKGGLSNRKAIEAITCNAARLCGLEGVAGVIAPGAAADLIAVEGNPLDDLERLKDVRFVMQEGRTVDGVAGGSGRPARQSPGAG